MVAHARKQFDLFRAKTELQARLVTRQRDSGVSEEFADLLDFLPGAGRVVVRVVQESFDLVQHNPEAGAVSRFDARPHMRQQRFDLPPVNVGAGRVMINALQQM